MRDDQGGTHPKVVIGLAVAPAVIAVAGWIRAQSIPDRITEAGQWTSAYVHALAASTFAVILLISTIINLIVVARRLRYAPRAYPLAGYPLWQGIVIVLGVGWFGAVTVTVDVSPVEPIVGVGIAVASVIACVFAARRSPQEIADARARAAERSPEDRTRSRQRFTVITVASTLFLVVGVVVAQLLVIERKECNVVSAGRVNGVESFYTSNCGDFALDPSRTPGLTMEEVLYSSGSWDITTQGYRLGLPPLPVVIDLVPSE